MLREKLISVNKNATSNNLNCYEDENIYQLSMFLFRVNVCVTWET